MNHIFHIPRSWHARSTILFIATALTIAATAAGQLRPKVETSPQPGVSVKATIYGVFDYTFEGTGAWVGYCLVALGDMPVKRATFVDRNTSFDQRSNGAIYGTETISLRFEDGSGTFDIEARFEGTPSSTPGLYQLHETGSIANGTGDYSHASGHVSVQGPFLFPDPSVTAGAPPWIAELRGFVQGVKAR